MDELERYRSRRDFTRSPEPEGGHDREPGAGRRFVVQKHGARRTHFDLRLEVGGALKSWAVPRGPSADPGAKRLAVHVEDHPLDYADFEGVIPRGEYGAGPVIVWDRGRYEPLGLAADTDDEIERALGTGKLEFQLFGERVRGRWALVRMKGREEGDRNWLLLKKRDLHAEPGDVEGLVERYPDSVISGRDLDEQRAAAEEATEAAGPPIDVRPMLADRRDTAPEGPAWCYELKLDGIRAIGWAGPDRSARLYSRRGQRLEAAFPELADAMELLARRAAAELVVDGEIVAARLEGGPRFEELQPRFNLRDAREIERWARARPAELVLFDLLWVNGEDLRERPLSERKQRLRTLLARPPHAISYLPHETGPSAPVRERARREEYEGIVAKRLQSRYRSGERSRDWLKVKEIREQDFVVCGWTDPGGARQGFGSLLLGCYDADSLMYAGRVGSGFSDDDLRTLMDRLRSLERSDPPLATVPDEAKDAHWAEPEIVVRVKFQEWTREGRLRQPVFTGVRQDLDPIRVVRERAEPEPTGPPVTRSAELDALIEELADLEERGASGEVRVDGRSLHVTNLDKVLWPDAGITKGELLRYYAAVAPVILPAIRDRPLVLERYPNGIGGDRFYQQRAPDAVPDGARTAMVESDGADMARLIGGDLYTLLYTAQLAAISQHVWSSRLGSLDAADYCILDLDPASEVPFSAVLEVASAARTEMERLGIRGYAKTSGATGLHVIIPLSPGLSYETSRLLAELVARLVARACPGITTLQRAVEKRGKRIYLDHLQNGRGRTIASAYSVRPRPGASVSAPLRWSEVDADVTSEQFNVRTMGERLIEIGDLWAACRADANDLHEVLGAL